MVVERGAEPECRGGEHEVLHRRIDRLRRGDLESALGVGTHDHVDRRTGDPARHPALDLGEHRGGEAIGGERAAGALPHPRHELADRLAAGGVPDDDELPRLLVLCTRRVDRGVEHPGKVLVADRRVGEVAARALGVHDREEVAHRSRSPRRRNVFTYMIRSAGWWAQWSHSSVPAPSRSVTSGVIARNDASGSSVSIS